ncbi:hypothetical protein NDU88_004629 [Pleurodeles waltl]|uniref:Receptor ligand binding region domain-containing protein n=1 Tax=Pleurodeles waltl TaxID=8319 RepID=A0AAV7L1Y9_PLEWA|nr:hypothetical protein NDU88_004629 [Pleurodeles waltl]
MVPIQFIPTALLAMVFAVEEINQDPALLPDATLGFWMYDSCEVVERTLRVALWMLTGREEIIPQYRCQKTPPLASIMDMPPLLPVYPWLEFWDCTDIHRSFWEDVFGCQWPTNETKMTAADVKECSGTEELAGCNITLLYDTKFNNATPAYKAVYAVAHALYNLHACRDWVGAFQNKSCGDRDEFESWQVKKVVGKAAELTLRCRECHRHAPCSCEEPFGSHLCSILSLRQCTFANQA